MLGIAAWLERRLLAAVVLVTVAAVAVPGPGRWLDRHEGIDLVLVVLVLASGLGIPTGAARALRRLAPRLLAILVVVSVTLPLVADAAAHLVGPGPLRDGVLAVGVAPAEVASIGLSGLAGGDVAVAAALLAASTLVSVATAGPILSLLAGAGVAPGHVVVSLVVVVGLPLVVGLLGRSLVVPPGSRGSTGPVGSAGPVGSTGPAGAAGPTGSAESVVHALLGLVATFAVLVLVALVAAQVELATAYLTVSAVLAGLIAVSAVGGRLLGRLLPRGAATSALLHVSMRDFAIASGIAAAAFGPRATGPLGIYGVLVIAWGSLVATWSDRVGRSPAGPGRLSRPD